MALPKLFLLVLVWVLFCPPLLVFLIGATVVPAALAALVMRKWPGLRRPFAWMATAAAIISLPVANFYVENPLIDVGNDCMAPGLWALQVGAVTVCVFVSSVMVAAMGFGWTRNRRRFGPNVVVEEFTTLREQGDGCRFSR